MALMLELFQWFYAFRHETLGTGWRSTKMDMSLSQMFSSYMLAVGRAVRDVFASTHL